MKYKKVLIGLSLICVLVTSFCVTSIVHAEEENKSNKTAFVFSNTGTYESEYIAFTYDSSNGQVKLEGGQLGICSNMVNDELKYVPITITDAAKKEISDKFKNQEIPSDLNISRNTTYIQDQSGSTGIHVEGDIRTSSCVIVTDEECDERVKNGEQCGEFKGSRPIKYSPSATKLYAKKHGYASGSSITYETADTCEGILTKDVLEFLQDVYGFLVAICFVILIIMEINDFVAAVSSFEDGAMKKAFQKLVKRIIAIVLILLLPGLIGLLLEVIGFDANTCLTGF